MLADPTKRAAYDASGCAARPPPPPEQERARLEAKRRRREEWMMVPPEEMSLLAGLKTSQAHYDERTANKQLPKIYCRASADAALAPMA